MISVALLLLMAGRPADRLAAEVVATWAPGELTLEIHNTYKGIWYTVNALERYSLETDVDRKPVASPPSRNIDVLPPGEVEMVLIRPKQSFILRFSVPATAHVVDIKYTLRALDVDWFDTKPGPNRGERAVEFREELWHIRAIPSFTFHFEGSSTMTKRLTFSSSQT